MQTTPIGSRPGKVGNETEWSALQTTQIQEALYAVPFTETFQTLTLGPLHGQRGWLAEGAIVQSDTTIGGSSRAGTISETDGYLRRVFVDGRTLVWTDFFIQPVFSQAEPDLPPEGVTATLYFNGNGNPVVFNGENPDAIETVQYPKNEWIRVTVRSDYISKSWDLYINNVLVAEDLAFYDQNVATYGGFRVLGGDEEDSGTHFDNIRVVLQSPLGDEPDGPYAAWLELYFGPGLVDDTQLAANGVMTIREAYIAGLDPTNPRNVFAVSGLDTTSGGMQINWEPVEGRDYRIYFSETLDQGRDGFVLASGPSPILYPNNEFIHDHPLGEKGFYIIEVQLAE